MTYIDEFSSADDEQPRTLTLSPDDIRAASRVLRLLSARNDDVAPKPADGERSKTHEQSTSRNFLLHRAQLIFAERRRREQVFGRAMFGEPAWDMLLALYIKDADGPTTVGQLVSFSSAPPSTAQRWIDYLINRNMVVREAHPTDGRVNCLQLSEKGRTALDLYFSGTDRIPY